MMQHQEEDEEQISMGKEQRTMSSMPIGEDFASHSACPFLAPFSSVFHILELGRHLKSNNIGNEQYFLLRGSFTPSTSAI